MPNFRPFSACWGDISFTQAPQRPHGATQGRYFFHATPGSTPGVADTGGTEHTSRRKARPRCSWATAGPGRTTSRRTEHTSATRHHWCGGRRRVRRARAGFEIDHSEPQARVWRSRGRPGPTAPGTPAEPQATSSFANSGCAAGVEGTGGTGGCKRAWLRRPWAVAGPGRASSRRAERSSQRGRLAGGPPPTGAQSSPAPQGAAQQAISGSRAPSGSPTLRQHPSARAGAPNRRQPARGPRPRR